MARGVLSVLGPTAGTRCYPVELLARTHALGWLTVFRPPPRPPPMGTVRYGHGSDTTSFRTASSPSGVGWLPHARVLIRAPHAGGAPEGAKGGDQYGIRPSVHIRDRYGIGWLVLRLRSMRDQPLHGG